MATGPLDLALYGRLRAAGVPHTEAMAAATKATGAPPKPPPVIRAPTDRERVIGALQNLMEGTLPAPPPAEAPRPRPSTAPATLRAATPVERVQGRVRDLIGALATGVGTLTDPLGLTGFAGLERSYSDPNPQVQMGMPGPPEGRLAAEALTGLVKGAPRGGFYSRVDDAVRLLPAKGAHPNKVASLLKSNASAEELAYRQVPEFLAGKGNATVTPGELQAHLAAHPAPVPVVKTLGHAPQSLNDQQNALQQRTAAAFDRAFPSATTHGQPWPGDQLSQLDDMNARHWAWQAAGGDVEAMAKLERLQISPERRAAIIEYGQLANETRVLNEQRLSAFPSPKYAQYQLPGGEQYRETLLTLPEAPPQALPEGYSIQPLKGDNRGSFTLVGPDGSGSVLSASSAEQAHANALNVLQHRGALSQPQNFRSGHFDEPNILVHTRSNERTLPTGERGRFLEEVQSDWHQQGKKRGYQGPLTPETQQRLGQIGGELTEAQAQLEALTRQHRTAMEAYIDAQVAATRTQLPPKFAHLRSLGDALADSGEAVVAWREARERVQRTPDVQQLRAVEQAADQTAQQASVRVSDLQQEHATLTKPSGVPDAPFKESWPDLGLKQQLLETAADPQASWLGFTSGQTQAARYDLSKQISEVHYSGSNLKAYDLNGEPVINQTGITREQLPDYIGKEAADRLLAQPKQGTLQSLSGVDLQVGGEGMRHFYDQVLPKRLEKILKPFGGTVTPMTARETGNADLVGSWIARLTPEMKARILKEGLPLLTLPLAALLGAAAAPSAPRDPEAR